MKILEIFTPKVTFVNVSVTGELAVFNVGLISSADVASLSHGQQQERQNVRQNVHVQRCRRLNQKINNTHVILHVSIFYYIHSVLTNISTHFLYY